jgi:dephospho-CoA kinase
MHVFGITGGIGMGKSTAGRLLVEEGIPVVDTDQIARELVSPGSQALAEVEREFGADVIGPTGELDRQKLARIVFQNQGARQRLEGILHPRIRSVWLAAIQNWRAEGRKAGAVIIPLLYETGADHEFSSVVCVACRPATQVERLKLRGWATSEITRRNDAQWPVHQKMDRADFVIWTEGSVEVHRAQIRAVWRVLATAGAG